MLGQCRGRVPLTRLEDEVALRRLVARLSRTVVENRLALVPIVTAWVFKQLASVRTSVEHLPVVVEVTWIGASWLPPIR